MDFFNYSMLSGLPPIGVDLNLGAVVAALLVATLLVSSAGIVLSRKSGLPRRLASRWRARTRDAVSRERRSSTTPTADQPVTLARAIRLTMGGSRK